MSDDLNGDMLPHPCWIHTLSNLDDLASGLVSGGEGLRLGQLAVLVEIGAANTLGADPYEGVAGAGFETLSCLSRVSIPL